MRLRTTLNLASFFPIFVAALFVVQLFTVHFTVVTPTGDIPEVPIAGAALMAVFSLLAGWGFYRAGRSLIMQVDALERMTERIKRGDLNHAEQLPGGKGEVAAVTEVFGELVVELRGYVQLVRAHEQLQRDCDAAHATAEQLRGSAVSVSGALERLRRAEQGILDWMLSESRFLCAWLPDGALRDLLDILSGAPGHKLGASTPPPDAQAALRRLLKGKAAPTRGGVPLAPEPEKVPVLDALADAVCLCRWKWERERANAPIGVTLNRGKQGAETQAMGTGLVPAFAAILVNAAEAMPEGGDITVEIGADASGTVNVSITDTGHGMSDAVRARCMRPFFSTKEGRLGIGLTLAARLVEHCGGRLGVIGEEGKGTTVYVTVPRRSTHAEGAVAAQGRGVSLRVLLVEDDGAVRETLAAMLVREGHRATAVEDGAAAVLLLRQERFDVVMTDRAMPIMSGDELAAVVKARHPSTPVVMVTAAGEEMERQHLHPASVDVILAKPVRRDDLRLALARAMEARAAGSGTESP